VNLENKLLDEIGSIGNQIKRYAESDKSGGVGAPQHPDPQACHLLTVLEGLQQEGTSGPTR
jgi:hypothetical protein